MLTRAQATEIIQALRDLPAERVREVRDFALFLKERSGRGQPVNESDEWTDEDIRDFLRASVEYADEAVPWEAGSER
ncbi:MAG: DUF2281 domain-containing protein [Planctomycetes bacterium]|nr:DUF2281 domain-containing protein [Planctomycetota bacterium]